jgi:hypothetical protein
MTCGLCSTASSRTSSELGETGSPRRAAAAPRPGVHRAEAELRTLNDGKKSPDRVVFSWDISPQWQVETEPDNTSEVEVRFVAETPERTRVELEHRNIDRHGPGWQAVAEGVEGDAGWPLYLARYAALFDEAS